MKPSFLRRDADSDALAIDEKTMHQYYNTVQSDIHSEHLVDAAMARRHAMAMEAHRRQGGPSWLGALVLAVLAATAVWLLA